ncbi:Homeobox protein HD-1 [Dionaea muscipula]
MLMGGGGDGGDGSSVVVEDQEYYFRQLKAEIANHPLYDQLFAAHVACLRVATPIDQLPLIEAQLSQSHHVLRSYASLQHATCDSQELDNFLTQYLLLLCSFKEQLQQHVRVHAVEALLACREIEQTLKNLTVRRRSYRWGRGPGARAP